MPLADFLVALLDHPHQAGRRIKIRTPVEYPMTLDMSPYVSTPQPVKPLYDLYGVVVRGCLVSFRLSLPEFAHCELGGPQIHLGTPTAGHYIAYCKDSKGTWYEHNDNVVRSCGCEAMLYVLCCCLCAELLLTPRFRCRCVS